MLLSIQLKERKIHFFDLWWRFLTLWMDDISPRGNYRPKLDQTFFNVVKFIKRYFLAEKKAFRGKKAKSGLLESQQQVRQEKNCPCLWSRNLKILTVPRMSRFYPVSTNHKRRVGWTVISLKSGSVNSTESFVQLIKKLLLSLTLDQHIHQS